MYTKNCGYCKKFEPIFAKISEKYGKKCKFVKVDAETPYGNSIMKSINAYYVPYIVLMDSKAQTMKSLTPSCSIDYACVKNAIEEFTN